MGGVAAKAASWRAADRPGAQTSPPSHLSLFISSSRPWLPFLFKRVSVCNLSRLGDARAVRPLPTTTTILAAAVAVPPPLP